MNYFTVNTFISISRRGQVALRAAVEVMRCLHPPFDVRQIIKLAGLLSRFLFMILRAIDRPDLIFREVGIQLDTHRRASFKQQLQRRRELEDPPEVAERLNLGRLFQGADRGFSAV